MKELVRKFIPESIGKEIEKATSSIYPLQNVFIRKVKILKAPKFDLGKLMEVYIWFISRSISEFYVSSVIFVLEGKNSIVIPLIAFADYACRFTATTQKTLA